MFSWKIIIALMMSIGTLVAIPDNLLCCSPDVGVFQYISFNDTRCWNEASNETHPVRLTCQYVAIPEKNLNLVVNEDGRVFHVHPQLSKPQEMKHDEVCFGSFKIPNANRMIVICPDEEEDRTSLSYCMLVSTVFLLLTAIVYSLLPEVRDVQGKSIINFSVSMALGLGILSGSELTTYVNMTLCAIRGFLIYFFVMAAFFWANAMSIQVLLSLRRPEVNNYSWKIFSWYALYAWGCPTVLTLCMAIVNFHPGNHKKPGIGLNHCWFYNDWQQWYYMYSVMAILIVVNICIFIYTSVQLFWGSFTSIYMKTLRYKFVMTLRMFIIMGITWIFEMISSLTEKNIIWTIVDIFNALQGPLIFLLLVVLRKRVVKALLKRGYLACVAGPVNRLLAIQEDDEEGVVENSNGVMNEIDTVQRNGI